AKLATEIGSSTADRFTVEDSLKIGRALLDSGRKKDAREWILSAARRSGPGFPDRYLSTLSAMVADNAGPGIVTRRFAAEMASSVKDRLEAAKAYNLAAEALAAASPGPDAAPYFQLASYAAQLRLAELSDIDPPKLPAALAPRLALAWQATVGVDEITEHFALTEKALLIAAQPAGRALPRQPLAARLRAYDLATGRELWSLPLQPANEAEGLGAEARGAVAYSARVDGVVTSGELAYVLLKTSKSERIGASRRLNEIAAEMVAVKLAGGKAAWRKAVSKRANRIHLAGEHVIAVGFRTMAGYSLRDGAEAWSREFPRSLGAVAAVTPAGLVIPGWRQTICVSPRTGETAWAFDRPAGAGYATGCLTRKGFVYVAEKGTGVQSLICVNSADGRPVWSRNFLAPRGSSDPLGIALAGDVLIAARGSALRATTAVKGVDSWKAALPLPAGATRPRLTGAGDQLLWSAGSEMALVSAASGRPAWWASAPSSEIRPLGVIGSGLSRTVLTVESSSPPLVSAWRAAPVSAPSRRAVVQAARALVTVADNLAAKGQTRAAARLIEIAGTYATPGVLDVEWAAFRRELAGGGKGESILSRGLLRAALAAAAGKEHRQSALAAFRAVRSAPGADPGARCVAAAALLVLGDEAGVKHLAADYKSWTASRDRLAAVLAACRIAGPRAIPALLAGLQSSDSSVRTALIDRLAGQRADQVAKKLLEMLEADPSREVRVAAAGALVSVLKKERAGDVLEKAYKREKDFFARNRIRGLLAGLGRNPEPVHRPPVRPDPPDPTPDPQPDPRPVLTRQQALKKAAELGKVSWTKEDPVDKLLLWIAVDKNFALLFNAGDGSLTGYGDFLKMVGRSDVSLNALAFGRDTVWAGSSKGAFVFDRRTRAWSQLVINLDFDMLEAHIEKVELNGDKVIFTVKAKGRFEQDLKTRKWRKL
ncbi:MAG: outer membrane protein assembly factor BamB family protein, partial [Planctomycetota bacterium]